MENDLVKALDLLNLHLKRHEASRSFVICGGAALILQGLSRNDRVTKDIDIVAPEIDDILKAAAISVSGPLGLSENWLNDQPKGLRNELTKGWEERLVKVYTGSNLEVFSISRSDLIFTKFWAYCDRQKDQGDLLDLKVTVEEIDAAAEMTAAVDTHPDWPSYVAEMKDALKRKLGHV